MSENRKPRVAICIPSYDGWKAETGYDVLRLAIASAPHADLQAGFIRGQDTSEARNQLVAEFRDLPPDTRPDFILWVDADMRFPPDALLRLLMRRKAIVGADYRLRTPPFHRIGQWVNPDAPFEKYIPVPSDAPTTGVDDRYAMLGFGLILTHMKVFDCTDWPRPWFVRVWAPGAARPDNPSGFATEDGLFCTMARAHGFKIHCDLDLTAEVSHIGQTIVPWELQNV